MMAAGLNVRGDEADRTGWLLLELCSLKAYLPKLGQVRQKPHDTEMEWQLVLNCLGPEGRVPEAGASKPASSQSGHGCLSPCHFCGGPSAAQGQLSRPRDGLHGRPEPRSQLSRDRRVGARLAPSLLVLPRIINNSSSKLGLTGISWAVETRKEQQQLPTWGEILPFEP